MGIYLSPTLGICVHYSIEKSVIDSGRNMLFVYTFSSQIKIYEFVSANNGSDLEMLFEEKSCQMLTNLVVNFILSGFIAFVLSHEHLKEGK